jgi:stage II sporulation protein E
MVYGSARRNVIFRGSQRSLSLNFERLTALAEEALPFKLDRNDRDIYDAGDISVMMIKEAPAISVTYSLRSSTAAGQELCGDDLVAFCDDDAHFYACISDGMGSGRRAAAASQVVVDFIECMLSSGAATYGRSARSIIEMLNGFLRTKNFGSVDECSATVDLLELDTVNKSAFFCKCGAAPTYVYRGGSLFKLRSDTLPIGIMAEVDCRAIKFSVDAGDLLVMMSDGVVQGRDECPWLYDLLRANADKSSPDSIADKIIKYAKNSGSTDDISVAVIKIK